MSIESENITVGLKRNPHMWAGLCLDRSDGTISNHPWVQALIISGLVDLHVLLDSPEDERPVFSVRYDPEIKLYKVNLLTLIKSHWLTFPLFLYNRK